MDTQKIRIYFFFSLLVVTLLLMGSIFYPFFTPLALALTLAVILEPVQKKMLSYFKRKTNMATLATLAIFLAVIIGPVTFLGYELFNESRDFYIELATEKSTTLSPFMVALEKPIRALYPEFSFDIAHYAKTVVSIIVNNLDTVFSGTANVAFGLFLTAIALFYFLKDGNHFKKVLIHLSPLSDKDDTDIFNKLTKAINSVIKGSLFVSMLQGTVTGIGLFVFGVPHALLWGSCAAFCALIPTVGTSLILLPSIIYLFISGQTEHALGLFFWGILAVGLIDNLLLQHVMGENIPVHPFLILLSVLGGVSLFGPAGFLLGPLVLSFLSALLDIYNGSVLDDVRKKTTHL